MADWLIVGAGFTGATLAERIATRLGQSVHILDQRPHPGGNAYDYLNSAGIRVHKYGPHLFHTNAKKIWNYVQGFSQWTPYSHHVLAEIDGKLVPVPFNFNSIEALLPASQAQAMIARLEAHFPKDARIAVLALRQHEDAQLRDFGDFVYEKVFAHYTRKQWGLAPDELAASVTARVPVLMGRDNRYFQDKYQALPVAGYTSMFENMLRHPKIKLSLNVDYHGLAKSELAPKIIYTGPIDRYFDYCYGPLPYRSLEFVEEISRGAPQAAGTINYPGKEPFTRVTEMTLLTGAVGDRLTRIREFPQPHQPSVNEPYYPIPRAETAALYQKYAALARKSKGTLFCGRLANYRYYNMDQAIAAALTLFQRRILPGA